jgi:hypothetical protein
MITGKTVGGYRMYRPDNLLDRETALRLWTVGSAWFSNDDGRKGRIAVGHLADFIVPSGDFFRVPEDDIKDLVSDLTVVGGRIVHGAGDFAGHAPPQPKASPDWSPINHYGGYQQSPEAPRLLQRNRSDCCATPCGIHAHAHGQSWLAKVPVADERLFWGAVGCGCWL